MHPLRSLPLAKLLKFNVLGQLTAVFAIICDEKRALFSRKILWPLSLRFVTQFGDQGVVHECTVTLHSFELCLGLIHFFEILNFLSRSANLTCMS